MKKKESEKENSLASTLDEKFVIYMLGNFNQLLEIILEIEKRYGNFNRHNKIRVEQWVIKILILTLIH
jgi:hypothetical protein